jgi:UDP-N-acetylmuramoyl-L-alanyl-D-glutamate--2,6-diaminopimelate ligase
LKKLVDNQCDIAIIEVTSEGVKQKRNLYIDFDIVLVTNINKEHIESHGGYEKYKEAKASVFKNLHMTFAKGLPKTIIVNNDNLEAKTFASYKADRYISFGSDSSSTLMVSDVVSDFTKSSFSLTCDKIPYQVCIPAGGPFVVDNAVAAMAVAYACDVPCDVSIKTLATLHNPPGRFEIVATNPYTIVDYAHTIAGVEKLLSFIQNHWDGEIVHVFGAAGGGRDTWKRPELAKLSETYTDISILTEENPFDESVLAIIDDIRAGFTSTRTVYREPHRRDAVKKGIEIARERKALLVLTAKGSETVIAGPSGKKYPYNEKETVICLINT